MTPTPSRAGARCSTSSTSPSTSRRPARDHVAGGALTVASSAWTFAFHGAAGPRDVGRVAPRPHTLAVVGERPVPARRHLHAEPCVAWPIPPRPPRAIGGVDLRGSPASRDGARLRLVPQDGFLFDTTVREKRPRRTPRRDGPRRSSTPSPSCGLDDWVERLPLGLDTVVGERGDGLSVGERQLVALVPRAGRHARAARARRGDRRRSTPRPNGHCRPRWLRVAQGRTTVSIAHRLSTAEAADLMLVFDGGGDRRAGSRERLLATGSSATPSCTPAGSAIRDERGGRLASRLHVVARTAVTRHGHPGEKSGIEAWRQAAKRSV